MPESINHVPSDATPGAHPHRYFVSYAHRIGFGNTEIELRLPIRGIRDVQLLSEHISQDTGLSDVIVLNFVPLPQ